MVVIDNDVAETIVLCRSAYGNLSRVYKTRPFGFAHCQDINTRAKGGLFTSKPSSKPYEFFICIRSVLQ